MPAPAKTTDAGVLNAARALLEAGGPEAVTMQAVATAVGVRGPSLYKRFRDRAAILAALELAALAEVADRLAAAGGTDPRSRVVAQARAFRAYAAAHPRAYALIFAADAAAGEAHLAARGAALAPVLGPMAALAGGARALTAARVLTAFLHGFVSIEQGGLFRLGGDIDAAFEDGLGIVLDGVAGAAR